jgi:HEAT repeat protein
MFIVGFALSVLASGLPTSTATQDAGESARVAMCRSHYEAVEHELECADVRALSAQQCAERARLIEVLRAYRERGEFGLNFEVEGARVPQFVDLDGRRCAVAELLHASGQQPKIDFVRSTNNRAWICDLAGDAEFEAWLDRSGLSIEEAARIQLPGTGTVRSPAPTGSTPGGASSGPARPREPSPSGPSTGGRSSGGAALPAPAPGSTGGLSRSLPATASATTGSDEEDQNAWWMWWEYNKLMYLRPNRLEASFIHTGGDAKDLFQDQLASMRSARTPWLIETLEHGDARLRATTAVTLGRIAGDAAVEPLKKYLHDPSLEVRHRAILSLGATGSPAAQALLLTIARTGKALETGSERISARASSLAIVALGLGRRAGFGPEVDADIVKLVKDSSSSEHDDIAMAAMVYHTLAPGNPLPALALELATSRSESAAVRCRAVESMRSVNDPSVLSKLQDLLSGPRLELRRSAALSLGGAKTALALPALMTAFETEAEPMTRGFLLIAIGEQGGPKARDFLLKKLTKGDKGSRCWAALGLGIACRNEADEEVRGALRAATALEKNRDSLGAYWIASGLAQDEQATAAIHTALVDAANPRMRMYAATALALIGSNSAHAMLLEGLDAERSPMVRVTIGQALGYLGRPADAPAILEMMGEIRETSLQGLTAVAIGYHGSSEALIGLSEIARIDDGTSVRRAAAIDGLGMMLSRVDPLAFAEVSRGSNYTMSPDWMLDLYQVTL